jgi:hypothetical protein
MIPQIPKEMKPTFEELRISQILRKTGITKARGFSALNMFLTTFLLAFEKQSWFQKKEMSDKSDSTVGKDSVYRFLSHPGYNWKRFLSALSRRAVALCRRLTSDRRVTALVVDDSLFSRTRSKKVELLSKVFDHTTGKFVKGYQMLTLGWTDGATFIPLGFSLVAYTKMLLCQINEQIDKRTSGYKRRMDSLKPKPVATFDLIAQALKSGITADYVLMDSWFIEEPLIKKIIGQGFDVIGMVKRNPKRQYWFDGKKYTIDRLLSKCNRNKQSKDIIGSIVVKMSAGTSVKIVFIRHRSNPNKWLAILSTDVSISDEEIIRVYGYRWSIEVFFKCIKSHLNLAKEFQCRSFDSLIAHTTIVFTRYIFLAWEQRKTNDDKTLGYLFFEFGEDVAEVDFKDALRSLMVFVLEVVKTGEREIIINVQEFKNALLAWMCKLPPYIRRLLLHDCSLDLPQML